MGQSTRQAIRHQCHGSRSQRDFAGGLHGPTLFLQDHAEWNDYTGGAIIGAVVSLIVFLVAFPEFLRFRGYVTLLEELKEIQSTSELRRRKAEGVEAAEALGAGHLEEWNAFLDKRGVKR